MWVMNLAIVASIGLLMIPKVRNTPRLLIIACLIALAGLWIDKGFLLVPAAFIPDVFNQIREYPPSWVELTVSLGIYGAGFLVLTVLYKIATLVREGTRFKETH